MIIHTVNIYHSVNDAENNRMRRARLNWRQLEGRDWRGVYRESYGRDSGELGDSRKVPFVKDIIDSGYAQVEGGEDVICITNADSFLVQDCRARILERIGEAMYSRRVEVYKTIRGWPTGAEMKIRGEYHNGIDLIAMTAKWWEAHRESFPDLLLGYCGWDWIFKFMIGAEGESGVPLVWHENHGVPYWHANFKNPGCLHNQRLCRKWVRDSGRWKEIVKEWPDLANKYSD